MHREDRYERTSDIILGEAVPHHKLPWIPRELNQPVDGLPVHAPGRRDALAFLHQSTDGLRQRLYSSAFPCDISSTSTATTASMP